MGCKRDLYTGFELYCFFLKCLYSFRRLGCDEMSVNFRVLIWLVIWFYVNVEDIGYMG